MSITIEDIERLADQQEKTEQEQRAKLFRLICAEARVLAGREPAKFPRKCLEERDAAGHFDNSFPPKQERYNRSGPRLLCLVNPEDKDVPTTGGFYYHWKRVTEHPGVFVRRDGVLFGRTAEGTGRVGPFAAHPGDCDVEVYYSWDKLGTDEISLEDLQEAEKVLRGLAFPASVASED